jgi:hypothetical protein
VTPSLVNAWKQRGVVFLWRYVENERNYAGWHFTADAEGAASLCELLRAMASHPTSSHRTLLVTRPTVSILEVPNNKGGSAHWSAPKKWRITYLPEAANIWEFDGDAAIANLSLGSALLPRIIAAAEGIVRGQGDFSIGPPNGRGSELWFWWHAGAA